MCNSVFFAGIKSLGVSDLVVAAFPGQASPKTDRFTGIVETEEQDFSILCRNSD
jgi:hypothetical protein